MLLFMLIVYKNKYVIYKIKTIKYIQQHKIVFYGD